LFRSVLLSVAVVAVVGLGAFSLIAPGVVDRSLNQLAPTGGLVSEEAAALHTTLRLADLHTDSLLWDRDFLKRNRNGHADFPRLVEGGYRLTVLSAVTKTPKNLNYDRNEADSDNITPLVMAQRWPVSTWSSLEARALHIARLAYRAEKRTNGALRIVRDTAGLDAALGEAKLGVILATEGAHPLEGDIAALDRLYDAGYRVLGLHHFFDNELGGSLHGVSHRGLTDFGKEAVKAAIAKGFVIDVAHSSVAAVRDVLALTDAPLIVSHTGLYGHCPNARNLPDDLVREIAARGGLIGVGFWDGAVCTPTPESIAKAIAYAVRLVGADHVALGSDFDGATTTPFDAAGVALLTDALLKEGLDPSTIRAVMGENEIEFFRRNLPQ
jgi:microsomal dipeptidase-like Zn-dependent dipeptidase